MIPNFLKSIARKIREYNIKDLLSLSGSVTIFPIIKPGYGIRINGLF